MNFSLVLLLVGCVVYVSGEDCKSGSLSECSHMSCSHHFHLDCVQQTCTCSTNSASCQQRAECTALSFDCDRFSGWHCVDGRCRCGGSWTWNNN